MLRNLFVELTQLDLEAVNVVMDRGFCTINNLQTMYKADIGFIVGAKRQLDLVKPALKRIRPRLKLCIPRAYHPAIEAYCQTECAPWVINTRAGAQEEKKLYTHMWIQFCETAGFTVLLSNEVSDPVAAMQIYQHRDIVEKAFCNFKDRCSARRFQCEELALEGKVFVLYVALSLLLMLKKRLSDKKLPSDSTPKYLEQLGAIKLCRIDGTTKRYWQELSKEDRKLFEMANVELPKSII